MTETLSGITKWKGINKEDEWQKGKYSLRLYLTVVDKSSTFTYGCVDVTKTKVNKSETMKNCSAMDSSREKAVRNYGLYFYWYKVQVVVEGPCIIKGLTR